MLLKKRIMVVALCFTMVFGLVGCGVVEGKESYDVEALQQRIEELEAENEELKEELEEFEEAHNDVAGQETWTDDTIISFGDSVFLGDIRDFTGVTERDITYGDVKYITIYDTCDRYGYGNYDNLSALRYFTSLEELSVCGDFSSLNGIENLKNLEKLTIKDCDNLSDISALSGLTNLKELEIYLPDSVTDISVLLNLNNLESVKINVYDKEKSNLNYEILDEHPYLKEYSVHSIRAGETAAPDAAIEATPSGDAGATTEAPPSGDAPMQ